MLPSLIRFLPLVLPWLRTSSRAQIFSLSHIAAAAASPRSARLSSGCWMLCTICSIYMLYICTCIHVHSVNVQSFVQRALASLLSFALCSPVPLSSPVRGGPRSRRSQSRREQKKPNHTHIASASVPESRRLQFSFDCKRDQTRESTSTANVGERVPECDLHCVLLLQKSVNPVKCAWMWLFFSRMPKTHPKRKISNVHSTNMQNGFV